MGVGMTFRVLFALELRDLLHGGWTAVRAAVSIPHSQSHGAWSRCWGW